MKILSIIGVPGIGKTSTMLKLIDKLGGITAVARFGLLDYAICDRVIILGKYEPGKIFGGCDALSMAVQPDAETFLFRQQDDAAFDAVIFEGDRLGCAKFFRHARTCGEFRLIVLTASPEILKARREGRSKDVGKQQDGVWLKGREQKVHNLLHSFFGEERTIDTDEQVEALLTEILDWIHGTGAEPVNPQGRLF